MRKWTTPLGGWGRGGEVEGRRGGEEEEEVVDEEEEEGEEGDLLILSAR